MIDLALLGPAAVDDEDLAAIVSGDLGTGAEIVHARAEVAPYDLEALTTGGRFWVCGSAHIAGEQRDFRIFVKIVQSWTRSPSFAFVPEQYRANALAAVPWRTEPEVYRSDLARRLPAGLRLPAVYAVTDIDDESAAIWLEDVRPLRRSWDADRHEHAAYLLGRMAGSPLVRPVAEAAGSAGRTIRDYSQGRLAGQVLPALRDQQLRHHPLLATAYDDELRLRLLAAADQVESIVAEAEAMPHVATHGDACTRNLLVTADHDGFTLIDFGFWGLAPVGADLSQLLLGEVQMGERPAAGLVDLAARCTSAFARGLEDEGMAVPVDRVRRSAALWMLMFAGLPTIPLERLEDPPSAELRRLVRERADSARFILDLVDATA